MFLYIVVVIAAVFCVVAVVVFLYVFVIAVFCVVVAVVGFLCLV